MYNHKTSGGCEFIITTRYLEKIGLSLKEFRERGYYVVVAVNYFT
jgi:hypothetical protein